ncbi:sulfite exporter TauE/SafE family protein [Planctellipticum variicoloris]|uniref:sulfite exporter TauE/SafE family protein n=1 Tax=Planctellipticum variicoloris TaxID=3064265 RepID=UPI003013E391|nr:sulfite exporter TauE/SafE family protein [Planctomycetaceae bacterium SH412]
MPDLTSAQWCLAVLAAAGIGISKSGLSGVSLLHVLIFAFLFGARDSTGVVLPMLIVGDVLAVATFRQHARWDYIRRLLPPAAAGVVAGSLLIGQLSESQFKPLVGIVILLLTVLQLVRLWRPNLYEHVPHQTWFVWMIGLVAGITTMLANAAGPIMALYLVAVALPKFELVGTSAWFFLAINVFKVPFSAGLGLIHADTLALNVVLVPFIAAGLLAGRWLVTRIPQKIFDGFLLVFAAVAALRLVGVF